MITSGDGDKIIFPWSEPQNARRHPGSARRQAESQRRELLTDDEVNTSWKDKKSIENGVISIKPIRNGVNWHDSH